MDSISLIEFIEQKLGSDVLVSKNTEVLQPYVYVKAENLKNVMLLLKTEADTFFDMLSCVTGIDNGPAKNTMEVVYTLYSIPNGHSLHIRIELDRNKPEVPSLVDVWKSANWLERETFDLFGIVFIDHPDLRRILLPANWEGYPLRKDYVEQTEFHGIKVKY